MPAETIGLTLQLDVKDAGPEELDSITRQLRDELEQEDVGSAELLKEGPAPQGTKSAEIVTMGGLLLSVLPSVLPSVVGFLQSWASRGDGRKVKIKTQVGDRSVELEYVPSAMSQAELKSLVETLTSTLASKKTE